MNEILILAAKRACNRANLYFPSWEVPHVARDAWQYYLQSQEEKGIEFDRLLISRPFKPRSTGKYSQCNRVNGFIRQIARHTDIDFDVLKIYFKRKAVKRGYPAKTDPDGELQPLSEKHINTVQAGYLNGVIEQFADENNIHLIEDGLDLL